MNILGIETSCDETGAAVVCNGRTILSNTVTSSLRLHKKYGGIIPEIASRKQLEFIHSVVDESIVSAGMKLRNIHAIAVTQTPGLLGSLLVGLSYAQALGFSLKIPVIEINHIKAHLYANFLKSLNQKRVQIPKLPAIGLIVSGGHSSLYLIKNFNHFKLLGQTRDDAAGEAFDKVARILNLGYPGGPAIDRLSSRYNQKNALRFSPSYLTDSFDFSFSGTKTAVLYHHQRHQADPGYDVAQVADAFQKSIISILTKKSISACLKKRVQTLVIGGGVAANSMLRQSLTDDAKQYNIRVCVPPLDLCMDNAAMIAGYAYHLTHSKRRRYS
jgi:N6-L-threonylcarbamoyladenine synthase